MLVSASIQNGDLTKAGAGTLTLTGANTYAATTISAGKLQIGDGGTTGTLGSGAVTDHGTLEFQRSNAYTVGNVISGTGAVMQSGSGTTTLTATNTFTGATTISAGTLEAAGAASLGTTSSVAITSGGTLLLSGTGDQVNGSAAVTLDGGTIRSTIDGLNETMGMLTLSGNSTIDFGGFAAGNTFRFADSSAATWGSAILSIWNWTPTIDHLYFGTTNTALTSSQLSKISFYSDGGSTLSNGSFGGAFNGTPFDGVNGGGRGARVLDDYILGTLLQGFKN